MKEEKWVIHFEYDAKTKLLTKMTLPADLPEEQRMGLSIPFIEGLRVAILKLDAATRKHSRILNILTIVLIVLTACLVGVGIIEITS